MKVGITYITPPQDLLRGYNYQNSVVLMKE